MQIRAPPRQLPGWIDNHIIQPAHDTDQGALRQYRAAAYTGSLWNMLGFGGLPGHDLYVFFPGTITALMFLAAHHFTTGLIELVLDRFLAFFLGFFEFFLVVHDWGNNLRPQLEQIF